MTLTGPRGLVTATAAALTVFVAGCGAPEGEAPHASAQQATTQTDGSTVQEHDATPSEPARTRDEQAFLDDLTQMGVPTDSAADTTVEVGIGICSGISEGTDTDEILDRIQPITGALAAQTGQLDTQEVGRALIEASQTHLCG